MTGLEIRTQGYDDLHPFPEYQDAKSLTIKGANIVQGVTNNGKTGIELFFVDEHGTKYYAATTARIIGNGLSSAIRGTMQRFGDDPNLP
jgi:hypothetical protein